MTRHDGDPLNRNTLASSAYDELRREIITVALQPGARLQTRALCERFAVGLSPIREALSRLASEGLATQVDHRGFAVAPLSEEDLEALIKARCWLNEVGLRQSIINGNAVWEEGVVLAFHRMARTPRSLPGERLGRSPAWEEAHQRFHAALIAASGSHWLEGFCQQLFEAAERYRHIARLAGAVRPPNEHEHRLIMEATVARNADVAVPHLNAHFMKTAELVRKVLRRSAIPARKRGASGPA